MRRELLASDGEPVEILIEETLEETVEIDWVVPDGDDWRPVATDADEQEKPLSSSPSSPDPDVRSHGDYVFSVPIQGGPYGMTL